jgi:hypothetical protein
MVPPVTHVTVEPARIPYVAAEPRTGFAEAPTIAVAKPEILPLLARMVFGYVPGVAPAVNKPELLLIVPAVAFRFAQTSGGGIATVAPVTSWPAAVYWMLFPTAALPGLGETVIVNN